MPKNTTFSEWMISFANEWGYHSQLITIFLLFCSILQTSLSTRLSLPTSRAKKLSKSKNPTKLAENFGRGRNSVNSPLSTPFGIFNLRSKSCIKSLNEPHRLNRRSKRSIPPKKDHLPSLSPLSAKKKSNTKVAKLSDLSKSSKLQSKKPKRINKKSMFGTAYLCSKVYFWISWMPAYITAFRICKSSFKKLLVFE